MRTADSLEKTLMQGKIEGRRRRGWQRTRWLDDSTKSKGISLNKLREIVACLVCWQSTGPQRVRHSWATEQQPYAVLSTAPLTGNTGQCELLLNGLQTEAVGRRLRFTMTSCSKRAGLQAEESLPSWIFMSHFMRFLRWLSTLYSVSLLCSSFLASLAVLEKVLCYFMPGF